MIKFEKIKNHKKLWLDSMVGLTWGFIATLVVGALFGITAINQQNQWAKFVSTIKGFMFYITPFGIGIGIGIKSKIQPMRIFALGIAAMIAAHSLMIPKYIVASQEIKWNDVEIGINFVQMKAGDVVCAWISSVLLLYIFKMFEWETILDIIILPIIGILFGILNSLYLTYITSAATRIIELSLDKTANNIRWAGILIAPIIGIAMGLALSMPTSSAAIALSIQLSGDAGTAAMAGTAAQMVSFAVMTYIATGSMSKTIAVGLGTTMIQMPNFMKKPRILIIPCLTSGVAALLAVLLTPLDFVKGTPTTGMGLVGLYGPIFTLNENGWTNEMAWINIFAFQIIAPMFTAIGLSIFAFKNNLLKKEWMQI